MFACFARAALTVRRTARMSRKPKQALVRPAPQPMSRSRADARHSRVATCINVSLGGDRTKPATVPGLLHGDPASGSTPRLILRLLAGEAATPQKPSHAQAEHRQDE